MSHQMRSQQALHEFCGNSGPGILSLSTPFHHPTPNWASGCSGIPFQVVSLQLVIKKSCAILHLDSGWPSLPTKEEEMILEEIFLAFPTGPKK